MLFLTRRPLQDKAKIAALAQQAKILVSKMTDEQKIAQKLMLDFRHWNEGATCLSGSGLTALNDDIKSYSRAAHWWGNIFQKISLQWIRFGR